MLLPRAAPGPSSLEVFLAVPDIQWPLRVWSHPCGSCLRGWWNKTDLVSPLSLTPPHENSIPLGNETRPALSFSSLASPEGLSTLPSSSSLQSDTKGGFY